MKQIKLFRLLLFALLLVLFLTALVACGKEETVPEIVYHTVKFDTAGGSEIAPQQVESGKYAIKPNDPVREGYVFGGWKNGVLNHLFHVHPITQPVTLSAVWLSTEDAFSYELIPGTEEVRLTGIHNELSLDMLTLPTVIKGFTVTSIGEGAFANLSSDRFPAITVPASITTVETRAFAGCAGIAITLEGPLKNVGEEAFRGCSGLTAVTLSEGMEQIPYGAFIDCSSLRSVIIPDSVKVIAENAFENCIGLVYAVLPENLERVEDSAFSGCRIKTVFCKGGNTELAPIIGSKNESLISAVRYSQQIPTENGTTWSFDENGVPKLQTSKQ